MATVDLPGSELNPMVFPDHLGPGIRRLTSALLYHGRISVSMPGWVNDGPITVFLAVLQRAIETSHSLLPLLQDAAGHLETAQVNCQREMEVIRPLGSRIQKVLTVYPGTSEAYSDWEEWHDPFLFMAANSLSDASECRTATIEFVWRVWEAALELGTDPDNPVQTNVAEILNRLEIRAKQLSDPVLLLAECALHRYFVPRSGYGAYVTDSPVAVAILGGMGLKMESNGTADASVVRDSLSFYLFDQIVAQFVGPMNETNVDRVARLFETHPREVLRMREYCEQKASGLIAAPPPPSLWQDAISKTLRGMSEEAQSIADLDRSTTTGYIESLTENEKVWATAAGLVTSALALPGVVTASLAITAFSLLGASAMKSRNERIAILNKSPWHALYQVKRQ